MGERPPLFSNGVEIALNALRPHGRPQTNFPAKFGGVDDRRGPGESTHDWFRRVLAASGDRSEDVQLEPNFALFARLKWRRDELAAATIHALVANVSVEDYYLDDSAGEMRCFRLDFDTSTLGSPFSHPIPHVHADTDSPRYALDGGDRGNVVADFIEFIYRHFFPDVWGRWAVGEWIRSFVPVDSSEDDPIDLISQAFRDSRLEVLMQRRAEISRWKNLLADRKDQVFPYRMKSEIRELLRYPT